MKKILIIFFIIPLLGYSQLRDEANRKYNSSNIGKYCLDASDLSEQIFSRIPDRYKKDSLNKLMAYLFSCETASRVSNFTYSNNIYMDWPEMEGYINEIVRRIMPVEMKNDTMIHAYIVRDGRVNAFSAGAGKIYINIGLFADVSDEATLAYIILHELGHYYLNHQQINDLSDRTGKFDKGLLSYNMKSIFQYTVKEEYSTDSLAFNWLIKSGYDISGAINALKIEERSDMASLYRGEAPFNDDTKTRKLIREEKQKLLESIENTNEGKGAVFLLGKDKYRKLKEEAKPEILKCLLNNFDYYNCTEKAFKFHLFDPGNITYISYIMESLRRNCYIHKELWSDLFITSRYTDTVGSNGFSKKRKWKNSLFKYYDPVILGLSKNEADSIVAAFYWNGEPKFNTYTQAYEYFYRLSNSIYDRECHLSTALSYSDDPTSRNIFIEKYLRYPAIKSRGFAEKYSKDSILNSLDNKALLVFDMFYTSVRLGQEEVPVFSDYSDSTGQNCYVAKNVMKNFNSYSTAYLPEMLKTDVNDYFLLKELERLSLLVPFDVKSKTQLHVLDSKYYDLFHKNHVNEIIFVNCFYFEDRTSDKSINAYKRASGENIKTIYDKDYGARFLDVLITNVRMQKDKEIHAIRYAETHQLEDKNSGINQIAKAVKDDLIKFAEESKKKDDINVGIK